MDGAAGDTLDTSPVLTGLVSTMADAVSALETYVEAATRVAGARLKMPDGRPDREALDRDLSRGPSPVSRMGRTP